MNFIKLEQWNNLLFIGDGGDLVVRNNPWGERQYGIVSGGKGGV